MTVAGLCPSVDGHDFGRFGTGVYRAALQVPQPDVWYVRSPWRSAVADTLHRWHTGRVQAMVAACGAQAWPRRTDQAAVVVLRLDVWLYRNATVTHDIFEPNVFVDPFEQLELHPQLVKWLDRIDSRLPAVR